MPLAHVRLAADKIDHALGQRIVKHAVDREIAPLGIFLGRAERHLIGMPPVAVGDVAAEGGHFDLPCAARPDNRDHAERRPHGQRFALVKHALNFRPAEHWWPRRNRSACASESDRARNRRPNTPRTRGRATGAPLRRQTPAAFQEWVGARSGACEFLPSAFCFLPSALTIAAIAWFTCSIVRRRMASSQTNRCSAEGCRKCTTSSTGGFPENLFHRQSIHAQLHFVLRRRPPPHSRPRSGSSCNPANANSHRRLDTSNR